MARKKGKVDKEAIGRVQAKVKKFYKDNAAAYRKLGLTPPGEKPKRTLWGEVKKGWKARKRMKAKK